MDLEKLKELRASLATLKKEMEEASKTIFHATCAELFVKHPSLTSFSWNQYTPSFNDGDPCYFGGSWDYPTVVIGDEEFEEGYVEEGRDDCAALSAVCKDVCDFLGNFDSDDYEAMFGDGVEVSVTKDGVSTSGYYGY